MTGRNMFSVFGGIAEITQVRGGRLRCQGAFGHAIIAGTFWASWLPIVCATWWRGRTWRTWATVGLCTFVFIVFTTSSSTPAMAVVFGGVAAAAYPLRKRMRSIRWALAGLTCLLHAVMNKPVWHLLARITVFDGSTGWYRYLLIDQCLRNFSQWWMFGTMTTENWRGLRDITNEYVLVSIQGGVFTLAAFLATIALAFRHIGRQIKAVEGDPAASRMAWALGCALVVHCANFIAVSYFAQGRMSWYLLLALIASQRLPTAAPQPVMSVPVPRSAVRHVPHLWRSA
jgi:hypothetical protein